MHKSSSTFSFKSIDERKYFQYPRSPYTSVSLGAMNYQATERISKLAVPKLKKEHTIRDGFSRDVYDPAYSGVNIAAINATCTQRLNELSEPRKNHHAFHYENSIPRPVSRAALKYDASERTNELAMPKKHVGHDHE